MVCFVRGNPRSLPPRASPRGFDSRAQNTDAPAQGRGSPSCQQHFVLRTTSSDSLMKKQVSSPFTVVVVTGLLVLIQMRGLWRISKYACFPLLSSQSGDSILALTRLVSAPNLTPENTYPKKPKTLRVLMRANLAFAKWLGFCENVASEMASVLSRYTTTNRFSASSSGTLSQSSENPLHQAFRHLRQLGIFPTSYCPF